MNTTRVDSSAPRVSTGLVVDLQVSHLDAQQFPLLATLPYDRFGAHCGRPVRRTVVSLGIGGLCFLVGLALTGAVGFDRTYVASPGIYLLIFSGVFTLDRLQWGKCAFVEHLNATRSMFLVSEDDYTSAMTVMWRRMTAWVPVVAIFLVLFVPTAILIAISGAEPSTGLAHSLEVQPIPSLPGAWFANPYFVIKVLTLDLLLGTTFFGAVALLYFSVQGVIGWAQAIRNWPVVPIPSAVRMRFAGFAVFYFRGLVNTSLAVLAAVLFYGGRFEVPLVALVATFAVVGLLCGLIPLHRIRQLVAQAQAQLAEAVTRHYVDTIYPVGSGSASSAHHIGVESVLPEETTRETTDTYRELSALEELMHHAQEAGDAGFGLNVLVPALLSQAIPLFGFLYPLIGRR
jgi:hypothetical protein